MGRENIDTESKMGISIQSKIDNIDKFYSECKYRIKNFSLYDKRIKLLTAASIIIETAMLFAYEEKNIDNTGAIFSLYSDGKLNKKYRKITYSIRDVRNSLVHINTSIDADISVLTLMLSKFTSSKFKVYIKDLFGRYNIFTDNELRELHEMIADSLGIDLLKLDEDEMFSKY